MRFATSLSRQMLPWLSLAATFVLGGCDFWNGGKHRYYTYCDQTGCYTCSNDGCTPTGGDNTGRCQSNSDCAEGCYCDRANGVCTEAGFCDVDSDCGLGFVCDVARHSCEPGSPPDGGPSPIDLAGGGKDAGDGGNGACKADADCPQGKACVAGQCTTTLLCKQDSDCGPGMKCDSRNTCVPGPTQCTKDADCAAGAYCANGTCVTTGTCASDADCAKLGNNLVCDVARGTCAPSQPSTPCKSDCDCGANQTCTNGQCVARATVAACVFNYECGQGECVNSLCHHACTTDANCGTGDTCQGGYCFANPKPVGGCVYNADCGAAKTCVNGACHVQCKADTDCTNPVDFCDRGLCGPDWRKVPQCKINADCGQGEECVNAVCRTSCFANADCGACVNQPVCQMGYCVAQYEISPQCKVQVDCSQGQSCVNASCK